MFLLAGRSLIVSNLMLDFEKRQKSVLVYNGVLTCRTHVGDIHIYSECHMLAITVQLNAYCAFFSATRCFLGRSRELSNNFFYINA